MQDANASTDSFIGEYDFNTVQWHWQLLRLTLDTLIQLFSLFGLLKKMLFQNLFIGMPSEYFLFVAFSLVYKLHHMKTYFAFISVDGGIQL